MLGLPNPVLPNSSETILESFKGFPLSIISSLTGNSVPAISNMLGLSDEIIFSNVVLGVI